MKRSARPNKTELEELSGKVISCAMKIHRVLGHGVNLSVYKHALTFEMNKTGLSFTRDKEISVFNEDLKTAKVTADFVVNEAILVVITTLPQIDESKTPDESLLQVVKAKAGLLLNFGTSKFEFTITQLR